MPAIRHSKSKKPPPAGFTDIEDTLLSYSNKLRDATTSSNTTTRKSEALWPIFQITHARSRYVYDLYYTREAISRELYEWLLKNGYADAQLIAKWKKQGYEKLCCLRCVQTKETNFGGSCICRVPKGVLSRRDRDDEAAEGEEVEEGSTGKKGRGGGGGGGSGGVQCVSCGCRGCASSD